MRMEPSHLPIILAALATAFPAAAAPPGWSDQFAATGGFTYTVFEDGPLCLLAHDTPAGPRLYIGGEFTAIAGTPFRSIAAFDGVHWSAITGLVSEFNAERVAALTPMPIAGVTRVVAAGSFDAPGMPQGLGYLDDTDTLRGLPPTPSSTHTWFAGAFAWNSPTGPELILSTSLTPLGSDYIFRYGAAGYGVMSPGVITVTTAFAVFDDGLGGGPALYIGVPMSGDNFVNKISRWNGSTLTPVNTGPMTWVNALCVHDDGGGGGPALYAAGHGFRRYRAGVWEAVPGAPASGVSALASFDDGSGGGPALYAAGQFTTVSGQTMTNIARLRAGVWEPLGSGLTGGPVAALTVFDEDGPGPRRPALYAVGRFTQAGGLISPGIARWGPPACPADFNGQGGVSTQDIFDFLAAYFASQPAADFNASGAVSIQDIFDFLAAYFTGCV
jgi:hypothetical protein